MSGSAKKVVTRLGLETANSREQSTTLSFFATKGVIKFLLKMTSLAAYSIFRNESNLKHT